MKNLILFFLPLLVIACGSSENEAFLPEEPAYTCDNCDTAVLIGTWRLTEFYSDDYLRLH
ncbi:hypothetical protein [Neolewinella agarilytica]|uniref:hypothetical protein n=1 Tax=Neolewinella agarilytica TaxID=478744 RepID=UPI00235559C1|nr:hypothetical protein [Neolewinella agarilytica]